MNKFIVTILFLLFINVITNKIVNAEMSGNGYIIKSDSINTGIDSTKSSTSSGSFVENTDTKFSPAGISSTSSTAQFTSSISSNACALGVLNVSQVGSCSIIITTTTNSSSGYVTTISEDGNLRTLNGSIISDVTDGIVTAGVEEYGIGLTGEDIFFYNDQAITATPLTIAKSSVPVTNSKITVTSKIGIKSSTLVGEYSHIITLISSSNF